MLAELRRQVNGPAVEYVGDVHVIPRFSEQDPQILGRFLQVPQENPLNECTLRRVVTPVIVHEAEEKLPVIRLLSESEVGQGALRFPVKDGVYGDDFTLRIVRHVARELPLVFLHVILDPFGAHFLLRPLRLAELAETA